ncbi:zinc-binding dehydrogenase [Chloroflexota bacterium]
MKGKAAIFTGAGSPMEITEYTLPELAPGEILVRVLLANICGSDVHIWRGDVPWRTFPTILGHEMAAKVHQLGPGVSTDSMGQPLAVGDRVVYQYFYPCGRCWTCISGNRAACPNRHARWMATPSDQHPHFIGAYAQYYHLDAGQAVFKVPEELTDEEIAPLNCALSQVIYGLHQTRITYGDSVVIQGAGGLGIYATAVAREMGATSIIVIDKIKERLKLAQDFGADHIINMEEYPTPRDRTGKIRELTGGRFADVVVELTGVPEAIPEGLSMARVGGTYLIMGNISRGTSVEIDPFTIVSFSRKILGVTTYDSWVMPRALQFLVKNRSKYPFHQILSHKFPLEEINQAFEQASKGNVTRAAIVP